MIEQEYGNTMFYIFIINSMKKFSEDNIKTTIELWKYTKKERNQYSLYRYVNYLNKPSKVRDLINKK